MAHSTPNAATEPDGKGVRALIGPLAVLAVLVFPPTRHLCTSAAIGVGDWFGHLFAKSVVHSITPVTHPPTTG
jgi:hypothetical protein